MKAILKLSESNYEVQQVLYLDVLPEKGDQFFLDDFLTESEEVYLSNIENIRNHDNFFVETKTWLQKDGETYVYIWLIQQ